MTGVTAGVAAKRRAKSDTDYEEAHTIIQEDANLAIHRGQTYWESLWEAKTNVLLGFLISWGVWMLVITPLWGFEFKPLDGLAITGIFTVTSLARQFAIPRWFNGRSKV